ncbi:MAG TPA: quinone oxidoreductase [Bryobacteraceae bacterium]|jgi:NADPH2:quinone reductase|nr:quinone oxidoreductase [Bryobacteraceae bacterium]
MKSIQVKVIGGPENLELVETPTPTPGPKQALVKIAASGVNFIDVYFRTGLYKADAPVTLGNEAAGTVEAVGAEVTEVAPGDRVAYAMQRGSYAEYAVVNSWQLVKIPDHVEFTTAAAAMLQGMTAHYLTHSTYALKNADTCLVHAAAGGTGGLIVQMAKMLGARVLGTVSSEEKAQIAREHGADEIIFYTRQDFEEEARRLTGGRGVDVVYDSVGRTTFEKSLGSLRPRGTLALFGQSSGAVPPFDASILNVKGSLFLTRPSLAHHVMTREELLWRAGDVLGWIDSGKLKLRIDRTYPLAQAAEAHRALEGRHTAGKLLLTVPY